MKRRLIAAAICCVAIAAVAGPIKVWQSGEIITATDINANFQHIHNTMVGSHGARLKNSDVSTTAAISHSKLAQPALLPKAVGAQVNACTASPCTWDLATGFPTTYTRLSAGAYSITFSTARPNAQYGVHVTCHNEGSEMCVCTPRRSSFATTGFTVECYLEPTTGANPALGDHGITVTVYDDNN